MTYEERKAQLNKAMADFLNDKGHDGAFVPKEETKITLTFCYVPREETLVSVYISDGDPNVVIVQTSAEDETWTCEFTELSNEEMEQVMLKCGVEIPHPYYVVTFTTTITRVYKVNADSVADAIEQGRKMANEYDKTDVYETWDAE